MVCLRDEPKPAMPAQCRKPALPRLRLMAMAVLLATALGISPVYSKGTSLGTPGPEDAPQLVSLGGEPAVRIPVAHQHAASGCGGYLYFSASKIRFEVLYPERDKPHAFEYPRADLVVAKQWTIMGSPLQEAEFKFRDGRVFHFFRVKKKLAENESEKMTWDNVLPYELLLEGATNYPALLASAQSASGTLAAGTSGTASAAAPASPPPPDASAALGAAGLDVPPQPAWPRAGASAAPPPAGGNGRP